MTFPEGSSTHTPTYGRFEERVAVSGKPNLGVVINQKGPASGVTGIAEGGKFALNIDATGPWKITVVDGVGPAS